MIKIQEIFDCLIPVPLIAVLRFFDLIEPYDSTFMFGDNRELLVKGIETVYPWLNFFFLLR